MDKISKFLKRLNKDERETLEAVLLQVGKGDFAVLDVKKLKGGGSFFRVRKGSIRIIFKKEKDIISIISIGRRDKDTYKNL